MNQHYLEQERENDPHALPNVETFHISNQGFIRADKDSWQAERLNETITDVGCNFQAAAGLAGWYYWFCFPGYTPDSKPFGPYESEQAAIDAACAEASWQAERKISVRSPDKRTPKQKTRDDDRTSNNQRRMKPWTIVSISDIKDSREQTFIDWVRANNAEAACHAVPNHGTPTHTVAVFPGFSVNRIML